MALNLNEKKIETFLEVTKWLNEAFNVVPILFGSLGLYKVLGVNKKANDIDVLVPTEMIKEKWEKLKNFMEGLGFKLVNEKEREFERDNEIVAFGDEQDLQTLSRINIKDLSVSVVNGAKFKELSAKQFLACYKRMLRDAYRQEKLKKNDKEKIKLIENYLKN